MHQHRQTYDLWGTRYSDIHNWIDSEFIRNTIIANDNRFIAEAAYFLGLGGIPQALATPDLANGFPSVEFILFFWGHGASLATITFLIASRDFKPGRHSIPRMMMVVNFYALVIGMVDAVTGWNYGYLCRKPSAPSLLDYLGPWPWYLLSIELIALLTFLILYIPWRRKQ